VWRGVRGTLGRKAAATAQIARRRIRDMYDNVIASHCCESKDIFNRLQTCSTRAQF